jgi:nucleotide-binding universal stress UspA family protein
VTVLVGFRPGESAADALALGAVLARSTGEPLALGAVVPQTWPAPSMARIDAEYVGWSAEHAAAALDEARAGVDPDVAVTCHRVAGRSVSAAVLELARTVGASMIVLGSAGETALGRIAVGSAANQLAHSSEVPLALATRGYGGGPRLTRVTCAFAGTPDSVDVVRGAAALAARTGARLRVLTVGLRNPPMIPPEVGLDAEEDVLAAWREQMADAQKTVLAEYPGEGEIAVGATLHEAMVSAGWEETEVLALGSSAPGPLTRVFLGSRATKFVKHSPVPVVVLPR